MLQSIVNSINLLKYWMLIDVISPAVIFFLLNCIRGLRRALRMSLPARPTGGVFPSVTPSAQSIVSFPSIYPTDLSMAQHQSAYLATSLTASPLT